MKPPVVYRYDGSFAGFLCCVFDSVYRRELPEAIVAEEEAQATLYSQRQVRTDEEHARRVYASFAKKISPEASRLIQEGFLTCLPNKELVLLRFIFKGYRCGAEVVDRLSDETVHTLQKGVKNLRNEAHFFKEFLRFSEQNKTLAAIISPKNQVLSLLRSHFCARYPEETFLIYDETHRQALLYRPYEAKIFPLQGFSLPPPEEKEAQYRALWKLFYKTIGIEGRYNPKCRMGHMPKRYWGHLTEFENGCLEPSKDPFACFLQRQEKGLPPSKGR